MRIRDILYTLSVLIAGTGISCGQFLINPYRFAAGGGGGGALEFATAYTGFTSNGWASEVGWEVTPSTNVTVTHLAAMFTSGSYADKTVSLRQSNGTLIEAVTIVFSGATLGVYTWVVLTTPRALTSGTEYLVTVSGGFNDGPQGGSLTYSTTHLTPGNEVDATGTPTGTGAALPGYNKGINIRYTVPREFSSFPFCFVSPPFPVRLNTILPRPSASTGVSLACLAEWCRPHAQC